MSYKVLFEIGPIHQTLSASRKLRDYAGASFLFSYLMALMAKKIMVQEIGPDKKNILENVNSVIKRPFLSKDPLFDRILDTTKPAVLTGTIPDRIYCMLTRKEIIETIKPEFQAELWNILVKCLKPLEKAKINNSLAKSQLDNYFRFFFITSESSQDKFMDEDDCAAGTRSDIFEFAHHMDAINTVDSKDDKCSLCGDRKKIVSLENTLRNGRPEHLCAVCLLKRRFLHKHKSIIAQSNFESTTDVAALAIRELLTMNSDAFKEEIKSFADSHFILDASEKNIKTAIAEVIDELEEEEIEELGSAIDSDDLEAIIQNLSYQFYFSDANYALAFKKSILQKLEDKTDPADMRALVRNLNIGDGVKIKPWLSQAFYCILTLDGDETGDLLRKCEDEDAEARKNGHTTGKSQKLSEAISAYSKGTAEIIEKNYGRLVFSGGEDTIAVLHPLFLIKTVKELSVLFQKEVQEKAAKRATLSAGAVICHHKHPLTLAIQAANDMLFEKAKSVEGKGSLAVKLIKGSGEACLYNSKIKDSQTFDLSDFERLIGIGVPRGFVYKLLEDQEILQGTLKTPEEMWGYIKFLYEKSRQTKNAPDALKDLVLKTKNGANEPDLGQIINRLYFARFLEGESL
jgi:CRISPR/Cas system-associated protein Cas10 (large subunit of type III CRISPR-Cas system)